MIGRLRGYVLEKQLPSSILLEVGCISYEIYLPITDFCELSNTNNEVIVYTHFFLNEKKYSLFGFKDQQRRNLFRELIRKNGIGSRLALSIISGISIKQFTQAIKNKDYNTLMKLSGIGKKTAERLIMEMNDYSQKINKDNYNLDKNKLCISSNYLMTKNIEKEAVEALIALGYKSKKAIDMIKKVSKPNINVETMIRKALQSTL